MITPLDSHDPLIEKARIEETKDFFRNIQYITPDFINRDFSLMLEQLRVNRKGVYKIEDGDWQSWGNCFFSFDGIVIYDFYLKDPKIHGLSKRFPKRTLELNLLEIFNILIQYYNISNYIALDEETHKKLFLTKN